MAKLSAILTKITSTTRLYREVLEGRRCRVCKARITGASFGGLCDAPSCLEEAELWQAYSGI